MDQVGNSMENQADYALNDLFLSNSISDLISFFDKFIDIESLVKWMKNRPKEKARLIINDAGSDCVVVVPTRDVDSEYAQNCREKIFKGITQIFVESKKPYDPYFNFSRNVNEGIKEALKMGHTWIIISNDDMYRIDPPEKLVSQLASIDPRNFNAIFTYPPGKYHSFYRMLATPNLLYQLIAALHPNRVRNKRFNLWKKFNVKYIDALFQGFSGAMSQLTYSNKIKHLLTGSFFIISSAYSRSLNGVVLDDTFINGGEDTDLSLRLQNTPEKCQRVNYSIGDLIGGSLGNSWSRILRNVVNEAYLNYKINRKLLLVRGLNTE